REGTRPGYSCVGRDQPRRGRRALAEDRELPLADLISVDHVHSTRPWRDVEAAGFTEVEEHGPSVVQEGEDARGTVRGDQVEVGHAPPEQRVSLAEVVVDVESAELRGDVPARLVHAQQFGHGVAEGLVTL